MQFLSDEWFAALDAAARARPTGPDDPLRDVQLTVEQVVVDGPRWRLVVDAGRCSIERDAAGEPDVRLTSDRATAEAVASGRRAALDAFIAGDLVLGGDVRQLLDNRAALEAMGDVFVAVSAETTFA